ncbi:MAG: hypothetical protein ABH950_02235 [Candidatus Altiarchaeota archaeon]
MANGGSREAPRKRTLLSSPPSEPIKQYPEGQLIERLQEEVGNIEGSFVGSPGEEKLQVKLKTNLSRSPGRVVEFALGMVVQNLCEANDISVSLKRRDTGAVVHLSRETDDTIADLIKWSSQIK